MTTSTDITTSPLRHNAGMRAMILAAGLGTRLKPWTDSHPKALAMVNGKSLLQRNIEYLQKFNIWEVIVNVHHFADQVTRAILSNDGWGSNITLSDESEELLDTGGGLKKASWWLGQSGKDFLLMNVDILTDLDINELLRAHLKHKPLATLAVSDRDTSRYFLFDENDELCGWQNTRTGETRMAKPGRAPWPLAFSGIHLLNPSIFGHMTQDGKFSTIDVYLALARDHPIRAFDHSGSLFIDVGKPEALASAAQLF